MSYISHRTLPAIAKRQAGISLLVVLILLVVTSVLGIAVLRSSAMQERMGANLRDRSLAFQAAEAAMRHAQAQLDLEPNPFTIAGETWDTRIPTEDNCTNQSICPTNHVLVESDWRDAPTLSSGGIATTSQYWIQYLGTGPAYKGSCDSVPPSIDCQSPLFRVTARSRAEGRAEVMLQSNVTSRIPTP